MSDLNQEEKKKYDWLSGEARRRDLTPQEMVEWGAFAARYSVQLEREGREYRARRENDMKEFLAEKKAWAEARDKH